MDQNMTGVFKNYLTIDSDYALLLNGPWGVGKTHFVRNTLMAMVREIETKENTAVPYLPIYVSLFGMPNCDALVKRIAAAANYKEFKTLVDYFKNTVDVFKEFSKDLSKVASAALAIEKHFLFGDAGGKPFWSKIVIFIDDLERKHPGLDLSEFIGLVNMLVDSKGVKVVLIANEDKLNQNEFLPLKEKVIGIVVPFSISTKEALEGILAQFAGDKTYHGFLAGQMDLLVDVYGKCQNLRIIQYALRYFRKVFGVLEKEMNPRESFYVERRDEILRTVLQLALGLSVG